MGCRFSEMSQTSDDWPLLPESGYEQPISPRVAEYGHNPIKWRKAFADAGDGTANPDMASIRSLRVIIWRQTEKAIKCSLDGRPAQPDLGSFKLASNNTETCKDTLSTECIADERPGVQVVECDMLDHAQSLVQKGHKVAVLNMACEDCPGGGFRSGAGAQEENMHRRSDLVRFTEELRTKHYPIPPEACLLSENVTVFRGSEKDGYPFLQTPFQVSFISCAALIYPRLTEFRTYADAWQEKRMRQKIKVIIAAAVRAECFAVVLSAFGCGAFGNPPEQVARLCAEELTNAPLKKVDFCVFNDHNSGKSHNPRGNYLPFVEAFTGWGPTEASSLPGVLQICSVGSE
eukprot:TRINITY_DN75603_c0_g1_i1.p1 TRINITY_DN75603_c0_g1~~TRINITY_DN75603_c0_g1_i1.p1  ORF type:complete len:346 (+),score=55.01 TRINITY_DN75603_c0_g1_i1:47-1084(+)